MHLNRSGTALALIALNWADSALGRSSDEPPAKPQSCDGVLMMHGQIRDIPGLNGKPMEQFVGNLTYSLTMSGALLINSTLPTLNCSSIETRSNSTSALRTVKTTFASAQLACSSAPMDIEAPFLTQWTKASYFGQVYVSIIAHDGICASHPTILGSASSCSYNATTDGGLQSTSECSWTATADVHNLGDSDNNGEKNSEE